jgi:hypothetical protein
MFNWYRLEQEAFSPKGSLPASKKISIRKELTKSGYPWETQEKIERDWMNDVESDLSGIFKLDS